MSDLEIRIRTLLEGQGIKATDDQLKALVRSAREAGSATAGTGRAAQDAGDAIQQFGRRGSEAKDAFEGLTTVARGGEGAIFGMAKAWRALTAAFAANPITAALALVLGLLPLIKKGFDAIGDAAEAATSKMAGTGERTARLASLNKELADESEKFLKRAGEAADAAREKYARLNSEIDGALRRFKEVESARLNAELAVTESARKKALTTATTDEERAAINARFDIIAGQAKVGSDRKVEDRELLALTQRGIEAGSAREQAEAAIASAEKELAAAKRAAEKANSGGNIEIAEQANARAVAAAGRFAEVRKKFEPVVEKAKTDQADVQSGLAALEQRDRQRRAERESVSIDASRATARQTDTRLNPRLGELRSEAEAAQARGDFSAQARAVAEIRRLTEANEKLAKAVIETGATTTKALESAARELDRQRRQIMNTREQRGGGG